jgi:peroxiredoxin Q/BCP
MPKIGEPAPELDTPEFSLKNSKSRFVVLYFYPKDGTANCSIEAQKFAAYYDDFKKLGAEIVGVSTDTPESHKAFAEKFGLPFVLISDSDSSLIKSYDVWGIIWTQRATFLIDRERNIAYIWRSVNVTSHAEEVLRKIQELSGDSSPLNDAEIEAIYQKDVDKIKADLDKVLEEAKSLQNKLEQKLKEIEQRVK